MIIVSVSLSRPTIPSGGHPAGPFVKSSTFGQTTFEDHTYFGHPAGTFVPSEAWKARHV
jgi:hypothetical protein